ncbi:uncharacterized protein [Lolium perenne]|uniref:uncharacterized protein n=1 Tax=Lolium perenne TaxID=4522 RepID=UPI0021F655D8|nr:uncharacterized protein LOC127298268 [Lolium perenne]
MAIAGNLALLACAKGRLGNSRIAGAASNPAAVSLRRTVPSSAPLLRPPPLGRSAAARCSPAVVRVARRNPPYTGDTADQVDVQRVVRKVLWMLFVGFIIWIGISVFKWRKATLSAAII